MPRGEFPPTQTPTYREEPAVPEAKPNLLPLTERAADELIINGVGRQEYEEYLVLQLNAIASIAVSTRGEITSTLARIKDAYRRGDYAEGTRIGDELIGLVEVQQGIINYGFAHLLSELLKLSPPSVREVAEQQNSQLGRVQNFDDEPLFSGKLPADDFNKSKHAEGRGLIDLIRSAYKRWWQSSIR